MEKFENKKPIYGFILAWLFYFIVFSSKSEATQVIVNKTVPAVEYSVTDIRAIFTMQKRTWSNKRQIKVYILSDNNPLHKDFVKNKLNMFPHQLRRVWDRLTFSGTGTAPIELDSEQEMLDKIANTPDSIGYLNSKPDNENIRYFEYH